MGWIIAIVAVVLISMFLESDLGKVVAGCGVIAIGLLLLKWITGWGFLVTLAKACAVIMVVVIIGVIVMALIN